MDKARKEKGNNQMYGRMHRRMIFPWGIRAEFPPGTVIHREPRIPIMIDGTSTETDAVREFNGQPLYTVYDQDAHDGKSLRIFTTKRGALEYCHQLVVEQDPFWTSSTTFREPSNELAGSRAPSVQPFANLGGISLYQDANLGGCEWRLLDYPDTIYPDFSQIWACGFLWWGWVNANDKVSSFDVYSVDYTHVIFAEDRSLRGSWIVTRAHGFVRDLHAAGWGDRISSMQFWTF